MADTAAYSKASYLAAKTLCEGPGSGNSFTMLINQDAFHRACWTGDLPTVKFWLQQGVTLDGHIKNNTYHCATVLVDVCRHGHLPVLHCLLTHKYPLQRKLPDWTVSSCVQFISDVYDGSKSLKYAYLTIEDIRATSLLSVASCAGHTEILAYLLGRMWPTASAEQDGLVLDRLSMADVRSTENEALIGACAHGQLATVQFLLALHHDGDALTSSDVRSQNNAALCAACKNGHGAVVVLLLTTEFADGARLTMDDVRYADHAALKSLMWPPDGISLHMCASYYGTPEEIAEARLATETQAYKSMLAKPEIYRERLTALMFLMHIGRYTATDVAELTMKGCKSNIPMLRMLRENPFAIDLATLLSKAGLESEPTADS